MVNSCFAHVEQAAPTKMLSVSQGELTPESLCTFKMFCCTYFNNKEVPATEQVVEKIALCFQDPHIEKWYMSNKTRINTMTFKTYMAELQNN